MSATVRPAPTRHRRAARRRSWLRRFPPLLLAFLPAVAPSLLDGSPLPQARPLHAAPPGTGADGAGLASGAAPDPALELSSLGLLEAVRLTLVHNRDVAIARSRVAGAEGAVLSAEGRFDPRLTSGVTGGNQRDPVLGGPAEELEFVETRVGLVQELRTGLAVESSVDLSQADVPGATAINDGTVAFTLRQPLLRDRGRRVVTADLRSLEWEREATLLALQSTVEVQVLEVGDRYWRFRAAALDLRILEESETSSRERLATTRRLVEADATPAADLVLLEADLASRRSQRIRGERELFRARQELGRAMGLAEDGIRRLPSAVEPFPEVDGEVLAEPDLGAFLVAAAVRQRSDLEAARRRLEASGARLVAAENETRPRLDLLLTPSWSGRVAGEAFPDYLRPLYEDVPGFSTRLGFSLAWPTFNRAARGGLVQARAARDEVRLRLDQLERQAGADVATALDGLRRSLDLLAEAQRAAALFEVAVDNEEKKLQAGRSTLIDVISQQDRLIGARQSVVAGHLEVALALLELRFQTGSLVGWSTAQPGVAAVEHHRLVSVPLPSPAVPDSIRATEPGESPS